MKVAVTFEQYLQQGTSTAASPAHYCINGDASLWYVIKTWFKYKFYRH